MDHLEVEWGRDWIVLAQKRYMWQAVVNVVMNLRVCFIKYRKFLDYLRTG